VIFRAVRVGAFIYVLPEAEGAAREVMVRICFDAFCAPHPFASFPGLQ
jgi:hypothetical protein